MSASNNQRTVALLVCALLLSLLSLATATARVNIAPLISSTVVTAPRSTAAVHAPRHPSRAMWVWNWDTTENVLVFSRAHGVRELYVYVHPDLLTNSRTFQRVRDLTNSATDTGIAVWAMGGDPSWAGDSATAAAWVQDIRSSGLPFTGLHLELEAHNADGFSNNPLQTYADLLATLRKCTMLADALPVDVSIPWWYAQEQAPSGNLAESVVALADRITIVTFSDTPEQINEQSRSIQALARAARKPYRLASETNPVPRSVDYPNTPTDWVTFAGQTNAELVHAQHRVSAALTSDSLFRGFAVEDYLGWKRLASNAHN